MQHGSCNIGGKNRKQIHNEKDNRQYQRRKTDDTQANQCLPVLLVVGIIQQHSAGNKESKRNENQQHSAKAGGVGDQPGNETNNIQTKPQNIDISLLHRIHLSFIDKKLDSDKVILQHLVVVDNRKRKKAGQWRNVLL